MPIYEYGCSQCGKIEEVLQSFSDKPLTKCKHCSGKLHKLISHSSFHLKGSGWYVTDYANKSKGSTPPSQTKESSSETSATPAKGSNSSSADSSS
ncbi:MAG: zinc ribbon domain-containing protein [Desulfobacterales bacterium]|nr:MAG: zinc ribbon domain-containing protein [Desulfobacterales bacterium]